MVEKKFTYFFKTKLGEQIKMTYPEYQWTQMINY